MKYGETEKIPSCFHFLQMMEGKKFFSFLNDVIPQMTTFFQETQTLHSFTLHFAARDMKDSLPLSHKSKLLTLSVVFIQNSGTILGNVLEGDGNLKDRLEHSLACSKPMQKPTDTGMLFVPYFIPNDMAKPQEFARRKDCCLQGTKRKHLLLKE